jgi:uncharacterized protein YuzE
VSRYVDLKFDEYANALYIKFREDEKIAETLPLTNDINMDITEDNKLVGMEFIFSEPIKNEINSLLNIITCFMVFPIIIIIN